MNHQEKTYQQLLKNEVFIDFSDPGTGKTRSQIDALADRWANLPSHKAALVIAPKSLLYSTWAVEVAKWQSHLRTSVCKAPKREEGFQVDANVYITNTDATTWLVKQDSTFFDRFDTLIIDELSTFKNPNAKRTKALMTISYYFQYRYGMTGTPLPNSLEDIWAQVAVIDQGQTLGGSFYQFRNQVCNAQQVGSHPHAKKWIAKPGAKEAVGALLSPISIRHDFSLLDLPPNFVNVQRYQLNSKSAGIYKTLKSNAIAQIDDKFVIGVNAATLLNKLLQACSGSTYDEMGDVVNIDSQRAELVSQLVEDRQHSVCFFQWKHQRDALAKQFKKDKLSYVIIDGETSDDKRARAVKDFQSGKYRVLLAHPAAAAHGLTLTKATATIWASLTYNLEHFLQGNRRIHRKGQDKQTETIIVMAEDTVEDRVLKRLTEKDATQQGVLDVLSDMT
jgi:SNF2 family DNA or RNA helicase